jgi:hypothetical protein
MYVDVYIHTRHTPLRSFINWELVSTSSMGHNQAIMQDNECLQKLSIMRDEILPFHIRKIQNVCTAYKGIAKCKKSDNVQQLHVQQPSTYEKPEAASAVLGS